MSGSFSDFPNWMWYYWLILAIFLFLCIQLAVYLYLHRRNSGSAIISSIRSSRRQSEVEKGLTANGPEEVLRCPCGCEKHVLMLCQDCNQTAQACLECFHRLTPCGCEENAESEVTEVRVTNEATDEITFVKCPCGCDTAVKMECTECQQQVIGCTDCNAQLSPCGCDQEQNEEEEHGISVERSRDRSVTYSDGEEMSEEQHQNARKSRLQQEDAKSMEKRNLVRQHGSEVREFTKKDSIFKRSHDRPSQIQRESKYLLQRAKSMERRSKVRDHEGDSEEHSENGGLKPEIIEQSAKVPDEAVAAWNEHMENKEQISEEQSTESASKSLELIPEELEEDQASEQNEDRPPDVCFVCGDDRKARDEQIKHLTADLETTLNIVGNLTTTLHKSADFQEHCKGELAEMKTQLLKVHGEEKIDPKFDPSESMPIPNVSGVTGVEPCQMSCEHLMRMQETLGIPIQQCQAEYVPNIHPINYNPNVESTYLPQDFLPRNLGQELCGIEHPPRQICQVVTPKHSEGQLVPKKQAMKMRRLSADSAMQPKESSLRNLSGVNQLSADIAMQPMPDNSFATNHYEMPANLMPNMGMGITECYGPCNSESIEMVPCALCHQPVTGCEECCLRLSPCGCDDLVPMSPVAVEPVDSRRRIQRSQPVRRYSLPPESLVSDSNNSISSSECRRELKYLRSTLKKMVKGQQEVEQIPRQLEQSHDEEYHIPQSSAREVSAIPSRRSTRRSRQVGSIPSGESLPRQLEEDYVEVHNTVPRLSTRQASVIPSQPRRSSVRSPQVGSMQSGGSVPRRSIFKSQSPSTKRALVDIQELDDVSQMDIISEMDTESLEQEVKRRKAYREYSQARRRSRKKYKHLEVIPEADLSEFD